ncbi:hypothetical protein AGLY_016977 [Aphis glycines]|uniref:Envelope fusion protein n=1 Tax=Aphis glycines TaxID=307491 RepID=A0A6G0SXC8_APHGL|nr:hypothetical protein AGLY_016977 [Aphis glycines]
MMVGLNSANEINSSEYYTYVPYEQSKVFYYENLGPTKVIGAEYKLVTYFSLKEYNTKYDLLGLKMKNITNICTDKRHIDLCGKYQIVITDLYDEITNQKERLYMSLGGSVNQTDVYQENKRNKRGLINFIGNAMYTLFGVCDDKCAKKTREAIKQTEETGTNILHIVKSQTTVVKTAVKKIASSLNQTEALYKEISTKEQKLHEKMMQLQNITDDVLDLLLAGEVHNLYTIITNQYAYETSTLEQIITAAREGLIHPSLMTPQELASILKTAERTIKKQYAIPMGTEASELSEFLKITKISVYYENEQLVFITRIPLVVDVELSLYNIIPIPIKFVEDGVDSWYISTTTYTYVAITKDRKRFTTYTEKEIKDCIETAIYRICKATQPMIDNNDNTPCEMQIFKTPEALQMGCSINKFPLVRNIYHRILNKNTRVHVGDDTLTISCTDLPESFVQEVKVSGAITILDINCQVFTRDAVLTPIEDISSTNYKDFVPTTKIQNIFNKIPEHIHKYKLSDVWNNTSNIQLTDLHSVSRSLDEIQQMIDEEVIREQSQKHQFIHSNLSYVSNRQVIDIPRRLANYRSQIRNVRRGNFASEIYDEVPFSAPPSPR